MSRYEIKWGGGDWDLYRDSKLIAWWRGRDEKIVIDFSDKEIESKFAHLDYTPTTEAHGLMILNAIKQQLESGEQP